MSVTSVESEPQQNVEWKEINEYADGEIDSEEEEGQYGHR